MSGKLYIIKIGNFLVIELFHSKPYKYCIWFDPFYSIQRVYEASSINTRPSGWETIICFAKNSTGTLYLFQQVVIHQRQNVNIAQKRGEIFFKYNFSLFG